MPNVFIRIGTYEKLLELKAKTKNDMSKIVSDCVSLLYEEVMNRDAKTQILSEFNRKILPTLEQMPEDLQNKILSALDSYVRELGDDKK